MKRRKIRRRKKMFQQKIMGILFIVLSIIIILFGMSGTTFESRDITPVVLFLPMGIYLMFTRECLLL